LYRRQLNAGRRAYAGQVRITVPDPALVLLVGPSGSGKSTFAAEHFRPTEIVSSDSMRAMLSDDAGDQAASAEAFQVLSMVVNGRLKRRLTTVVDATNLRAASRRQYHKIAGRYGISTVAIAFELSVRTYRERNARRVDRSVPDFVVEDQAARMAAALADLPGEGYAATFVLGADTAAEVSVERRR
jgi:predicted kinase